MTPSEQPLDEQDFTAWDTRLAAYAVIVEPERGLLLSLWNEPAQPLWTLPGGGVDLRETPEEGCVREVLEETGYAVRLGPLLGIETSVVEPGRRFDPRQDRWLRAVRVFYAAEVTGGDLRPEVGGSTDEARWWPLAELDALPCTAMVATALTRWHGRDVPGPSSGV